MALVSLYFTFFIGGIASSSAHTAATLGVQVARNGQMIMRHDVSKYELDAGETHKKPHYREAVEAVEKPSKIDDSYFAQWSLSMPGFIEEYPWFYACAFIGSALAFMVMVCMHVQYQESKDEEKREQSREAFRRRAVASAAMGVPRMGDASFAPPAAAFNSAVARAPPRVSREPLVAAPKARAAAQARAVEVDDKYTRTAQEGMNVITNAVGNFTGMMAGEKPFGASDLSTASGASTPRSQLSSQHSAGPRPSKSSGICNGTVLTVRMNEVIFASSTSWQEIGELRAGQQVIAAGPPEVADAYTMVPIKPKGAVDLKTLVVQEY